MTQISRRDWMAATALASATTLCSGRVQSEEKSTPEKKPRIAAFTKSFQTMPVPDVCETFREMGLDGLDLTVRKGGHILPENVEKELPVTVEAAKKNNVEILFLTTDITDADDRAERVLRTASELGIDRFKMGYYRYRKFGRLIEETNEVRNRLHGVVKLAARFSIKPCVHIHSGDFIPSHGTMLFFLLTGFPPEHVGAYVDPLHMTVEGGRSGWREGLDLLKPWISLVSMKNFVWEKGERDKSGQQTWHTRLVPLQDGICPLPEFVKSVQELGYNDIFSLHSEYKGRHSFKDMTTAECVEQTKKDLAFLKKIL